MYGIYGIKMNNRSLARNHLSSLANKGRYGDTKIAESKYVKPGSLWHVNEDEKRIMSRHGAEGEKYVDKIGSGTINPETGLEEKFAITAAAAVVGAGVSMYSAWKGGQEAEQQANYELRAAEEGLKSLQGASEGLESSAETKRQAAQQDYRMQVEQVSAQTGMRKEDLQKQTSQAIQQSGMASSGTIESSRSSMWDRIQASHEAGSKGLTANLGKAMGDIEGWYEGEKARLNSEAKRFENQKKLAEQQAGAGYLGKNFGIGKGKKGLGLIGLFG